MSNAGETEHDDAALERLIAEIVSAIDTSLHALVERPLDTRSDGTIRYVTGIEWRRDPASSYAVVRGALEDEDSGHELLIAFELVDGIALSSCLMMTPEEVVIEHRKAGNLAGDALEAFAEVGNILCCAIDGVLRERLGSRAGIRVRSHEVLGPDLSGGLGGDGAAPPTDRVVCGFRLRIDAFPATRGCIVLTAETAARWNGRPLDIGAAVSPAAAEEGAVAEQRVAEENDDGFRHATACTRMSAFLCEPSAYSALRQAGRRLGIEVDRRARTDIPNPAAHRGEIVVIEVPVGEEKRFDWARRIKQYHQDVQVVLLLHEPSRARVVRGFMSKANVIIAWPSHEEQLSAKIEPLLSAVKDGA